MYSIDGVPLQNPAVGWRLKRPSEPRVARSLDRPDLNASNRDGTVSVRGHVTTPTMTLVATSPGNAVESLSRLMRLGQSITLTSDPSAELQVEIVTLTPRTVTPAGGAIVELTAVYRIPGVWWRDVNATDWSATIPVSSSPGKASMVVCNGTTGAVHDALIGLAGDALNLRIAGRNSTYVQINGRWNGGNGARIDTTRGRAWSMPLSADLWADTSNEITSQIQSGAYPYFLELFPPSTGAPQSVVTLSWDAVYSATTVTVRAKNAYDR